MNLLEIQAVDTEVVMEQMLADEAYVCLNNLYLEVERGEVEMTLHIHLSLRNLFGMVCQDEFQKKYWTEELEKLPNWLDF